MISIFLLLPAGYLLDQIYEKVVTLNLGQTLGKVDIKRHPLHVGEVASKSLEVVVANLRPKNIFDVPFSSSNWDVVDYRQSIKMVDNEDGENDNGEDDDEDKET